MINVFLFWALQYIESRIRLLQIRKMKKAILMYFLKKRTFAR